MNTVLLAGLIQSSERGEGKMEGKEAENEGTKVGGRKEKRLEDEKIEIFRWKKI